jgi:hypothetical protein
MIQIFINKQSYNGLIYTFHKMNLIVSEINLKPAKNEKTYQKSKT